MKLLLIMSIIIYRIISSIIELSKENFKYICNRVANIDICNIVKKYIIFKILIWLKLDKRNY